MTAGMTCSMRITEDVRAYAESIGVGADEGLEKGLAEKAQEFRDDGGEIYR